MVAVCKRANARVRGHRIARGRDIRSPSRQVGVGGGVRRVKGGRCRDRATSVGQVGSADISTEDRVLEAALPGNVIRKGAAVEAINELSEADEGKRYFGSAVLDHIVDVEVGCSAEAVLVAVVEPNSVPHLFYDVTRQGPDLVVA